MSTPHELVLQLRLEQPLSGKDGQHGDPQGFLLSPPALARPAAAAIGLGLVAGAACAVFVDLKYRFGLDDSLDVVGVHLGAGLIGTLDWDSSPPRGWPGRRAFYGGGVQQLIAHTAAVVITLLLSGLGTLVIGRNINRTIGFRVSHEAETAGVDLSEHAESAYSFGETGAGFSPSRPVVVPVPAPVVSATTAPATAKDPAALHAKEDSFA